MSAGPVELWSARADADYLVATANYQSGLPNSRVLGAFSWSYSDDIQQRFGGAVGGDVATEWDTGQTNHALITGLSGSNNWIVTTLTRLNAGYNFTYPVSATPTLFVNDGTASTTNWISLSYHDGNGYLDVGAGGVIIQDAVIAATHVYMGDNDALYQGTGAGAPTGWDFSQVFNGTDLVQSFNTTPNAANGPNYTITLAAGGGGGAAQTGGSYSVTTGAGAAGGLAGDITLRSRMLYVEPQAAAAHTYLTIDSATTLSTEVRLDLGSSITTGLALSWSGVKGLIVDDAAVAAYTAEPDAAGKSVFIRAQSGGTHVATNPAGANINFYPGAAGAGGTGLPGRVKVWDPTGVQSVDVYNNASNGFINTSTGDLLFNFGGVNKYALGSTNFRAGSNNCDLGTATNEWKALYLGEDRTTATAVSTSGLYLGLAQEARLRWNMDATGFPAASLILGLNAVGSAAADRLALSAATVSGFIASSGAGGDTYLATRAAAAASGLAGGTLTVQLGAGDGAGLGGAFTVTGADSYSYSRLGVGTYVRAGIATTSTDALVLENTTAATDGVRVQYSPRLRLRGHAYRYNAGAQSESHDWKIEVIPTAVDSAATISSLQFGMSRAGGGYSSNAYLASTGTWYGAGFVGDTFASTANNSTLTVQTRSFTVSDSAIEACTGSMTNGNGTTFVGLHVRPTYAQGATTAAATDLLVSRKETSVGSGAQLLADFGTCSTAGDYSTHASMWKCTNAGVVTQASDLIITSGSLGATGTRVVKGWFTDLEVTNDLTIGGAALATIYQPLDANLTSLAGLSHAVGDLLYATAATTYGSLAAVAVGSVLISQGTTTAPAWSTDLATGVTIGTAYIYRAAGTDVAVADGGTGLSSYAVGDILHATGTGTIAGLADVAVGSVLVSGGVGVVSAWSATPSLTSVSLTPAVGAAALTIAQTAYTNTAGAINMDLTAGGSGVVGIDVAMTSPTAGLGDGHSIYGLNFVLNGDDNDHANSAKYCLNLGYVPNGGSGSAYGLYCGDTDFTYGVYNAAPTYLGGLTTFGNNAKFTVSVDSSAVADEVSLGRYEIGAGNTVLAISQETAVAAETDETKFSHKMQVRINGATYFLMLCAT